MMAALHGHGDAVNELLRRGANPNVVDKDGATALMFGCTNGDLEICEALLVRTEPTAISVDGTNALHIACTKESLAPLIRRLLATLDPNAPDGDGDTPLHLAAGWGLTDHVSALLAAGANPNVPNAEGEIPLAWAIKDKQEAVAQLLLPVSDVRTRGLVGLAIKAKQDDIAVALIELGAPIASWARVLELAKERKMPRLAALAEGFERRRRTHSSNKPVF
jgi:ankyrin repeat protein